MELVLSLLREWSVPLVFSALYFLGLPLVIKFSANVKADPHFVPVDPSQWPLQVAQAIGRVEHDLYSMSFSIVARYRMPNATGNTDTLLTMLVNYQSGDKAMITAIWGQANGIWRLGTLYTEFSTRFEDGHCFDTMNSKTLSSFARSPLDVKTQVPQVQDAAELFALHRFVMSSRGMSGRKVVYDMKDAGLYLRRTWRESFEEQGKFGRYARSGDGFSPTFKGAYLMTWGQLPPISYIRNIQMKARAQKIVSEWKTNQNTGQRAWDEARVVVKAESPLAIGSGGL